MSKPYLHSYRDKSVCSVVITGHESGSVCIMAPESKWMEEEIVSGLEEITCMSVMGNCILVAAGA